MGILPKLPNANKLTKSYQVDFRGLNHTVGAADSEIYDMKNLTSDHYPVIAPREKRRRLKRLNLINGSDISMYLYGDNLAYAFNDCFYYNGKIYGLITKSEKVMAVLSDRIIILPDKKYFDLRTPEAKGSYDTLEELKTAVTDAAVGDLYIVLGDRPYYGDWLYYWNGLEFVYVGKTFGDVEANVSGETKFLSVGKLYGTSAECNGLQMAGVNMSDYFRVGDAVTISGCTEEPKNNKTVVIREIDGDTLYFYENVFTLRAESYEHTLEEKIRYPAKDKRKEMRYFLADDKWYQFSLDDMEGVSTIEGFTGLDIGEKLVYGKNSAGKWELYWETSDYDAYRIPLTEVSDVQGNRRRYILDFMKVSGDITESAVTVKREMPDMDFIFTAGNRLWGAKGDTIYGSKLGDPLNFNVFDGLSTDSYSVDLGTPGDATAGIEYNGYPIFFKEDGIFKLYGDYPQNFQLYATMKQGVRKGCGKSLAIAGDVLYYVSRYGVMAYNGGVPTWIGEPIGRTITAAVAAGGGQKYYLSAYDGTEWGLYVYDISRGMWHKEDDLHLVDAGYNGDVIGLSADGIFFSLTPNYEGSGTKEESVPWMVEFADMVFGSPNRKGIGKMQFRFGFEEPGEVVISVKYDSGEWETVMTVNGMTKESRVIPLIPRRCDHFKIRVEGTSRALIYGMTVHYYHGSEL